MNESTKTDILNAAKYLFYNEGYGQTSIRKIADKCDIYHSNILYYYKNKQTILEYIFKIYYERFLDLIFKIEKNLTPEELILCTILINENFSKYNKKFKKLYFESIDILANILHGYAKEYYPLIEGVKINPILESRYLMDIILILTVEKETHKMFGDDQTNAHISYFKNYKLKLFAYLLDIGTDTFEKAQITAQRVARKIDYNQLNIFNNNYRITIEGDIKKSNKV
ncbi:MAG: TetR/AcrR family transcriptional regulator [Eubacteriaceae bacterium]|nr:TetR/AcrR family transcriptional regulator [Eubacteriaceae bacterium]